jgi:hypothetical protein
MSIASAAQTSAIRTKVEALPQPLPTNPGELEIGLDIVVRAAQQATEAAGAALALMINGRLVCRARVGGVAPSIGVVLDDNAGLTAACVRTGAILNCSDAQIGSQSRQLSLP